MAVIGYRAAGEAKKFQFQFNFGKRNMFSEQELCIGLKGRLSEQRHDPLIRWAAPLAGDIAGHFITRRRKAMIFYFLS